MSAESERLAALLASVLEEGNFDATQAQALKWVNARHELMCARTKCFRRKLPVGPTVEGQQSYSIPADVLEIREVLVQSPASEGLGVPYGAGLHSDLAQGALGYLWLGGVFMAVGGGIYARDETEGGEDLLALYPLPEESGLDITINAVCRPEPLTIEAGGLKTPTEFDDALIAAGVATGLTRLESRPDLAAPHEQVYATACSELEQTVNKRYRGKGAATIRVRGINAT